MDEQTPISRAVGLAGGITKLARAVGAKKGAVWAWVNRGQCPPEWARAVSDATDGQVTVHELRPDVFGAARASRTRRTSPRMKAAA